MGFLDNLLKKETRKIISNVVDNVVDKVVDNINDSMNSDKPSGNEISQQNNNSYSSSVSTAQTTSYTSAASTEDPDEEHCGYELSVVCERVEKIAAEEWSGYELRKNIPASEMGASADARDYSYGLYLNGTPVAMIMIIPIASHYHKKDVLLAHEACERQNVFCMNLLLHLPNRRSYISKQLRDHVAK